MVDALFEVSSEAGRQVGGIYTVLQSKSGYLVDRFGDNYTLIGMWDDKSENDFKEDMPSQEMAGIFSQLALQGIECRLGRWIYGSNARIIIVDAKKFGKRFTNYENGNPHHDTQTNFVKFQLWKNYGVDSIMDASWDFPENITWGWAVGMLLELLVKSKGFAGRQIVGQFHEWISGSALLYCKSANLPMATVFTTHATVLGRTLVSAGRDVLAEAQDPKMQLNSSEAYRFKVEAKHQLEMAAAKNADVFTTVSETVADEVQYILGRKADIITTNGMDFRSATPKKEVDGLAKYVHDELVQFCESYFIPYYTQNYNNCLLVFTSGRYEFTNKGFDIYLAALAKLNKKLKAQSPRPEKRIFAFVFAPSAVRGPRHSVIKNYLTLDKITEFLAQIPEARQDTYINLQHAIKPLVGETRAKVEAMMKTFVKDDPHTFINCYDLNYNEDKIINFCIEHGLRNHEDDVVKVIYYPTYVKPNDGLLNLSYYDVISGMDVGVFVSRYEPFGYTPVEAGLKFNVSITSDTSGFGRYMKSKMNLDNRGLVVLEMAGKTADYSATKLAETLEQLYAKAPEELYKLKMDSFELVKKCNWDTLISNYYDAYDLAVKKHLQH